MPSESTITQLKIVFRSSEDKDISSEQEKVWSAGINGFTNGFTGHMGSRLRWMMLEEIYGEHLYYAEQFGEEPPEITCVMEALAALVKVGLYEAEVCDLTEHQHA